MPDRSRVLLIGCGQLGSRHLQAAALTPSVTEIEVVDPQPESRELGKKRLEEVENQNPKLQVRWLSSLREAASEADLCIVATRAQGRVGQIREAAGLGCRRFLVEKIVAPSISEYEELIGFSRQRSLSIWVNCQGRGHPFHQKARQLLRDGGPIVFSVVGGNHGLATNGVHAADLFVFYTGAESIQEAGVWVDPVLHPSKRGEELFDLSGTLCGVSGNGSRFFLSYAGDHRNYEQFSVAGRDYRFLVDHLNLWSAESGPSTGGQWRASFLSEDLRVSRMTRRFAEQILTEGRCDLPTLEESFVAHRFILESLRPHFNRLLKKEALLCPVT